MKKILVFSAVLMCAAARGEDRIWTSADGEKTIKGEYSSLSGDLVMVRKADNSLLKIPLAELSAQDRLYVEYKNPPKIKVEYREETDTTEYLAAPWISNFGGENENHPIYITESSFGAEIIQQNSRPYTHDLTVEIFILTKQRYAPSNYRIISHFTSDPFQLNKENGFRHECFDKTLFTILKYDFGGTKIRGEVLAEYLVLVRDENGDVVGHNGSNKWMYTNLKKLDELPVGAWINNKCERIHPTSPDWGE